ncbi:MAG: tripartite tricarboxylate transporter TctB family protein [Anaerotruncus sp.]|nr:tripartite tricarboxylate transporter TctB family protein [Anaerotruncus sp.]
MTKRTKDVVASIFLILFASAYFGFSFTIRITDQYGGSALVPRLCSGILVICALILLYRAILKKDAAPKCSEDAELENPPNYRSVILTLLLIGTYAFLLKIVGFILSTILYLISQIVLLMPQKDKKSVLKAFIASILVACLVYLLFVNVFYVTLPRGIFW